MPDRSIQTAHNAFQSNTPGTAARSRAEARIENLRATGGLFVEAVRATRMPMAVTDPSLPGNPIVFANAAFLELSGYSMAEVLGQQPFFMNGADTDEADAVRFREALEQDRDEVIESVQYRKDGARFLASIFLSAFKDQDGRTRHQFLSYLDITRRADAEALLLSREKIEAKLRESEQRHRLVIESLAQAFWETDPDGVVVADSPSWRAYTGQTIEEWLGYGWVDAIHPDDRGYAERQWREAVAARRLIDAEFRLRAPDGGYRWTNVRAAPVPDAEGAIEKWVGMNINIDARKRTEAALRESEDRYRTVFESIDEGFVTAELIYDDRGQALDALYLEGNPAASRLTGGRDYNHRLFSELVPDRESYWIEIYDRVARSGRPERREEYLAPLDRWYNFHISRVAEAQEDRGPRIAVVFDDVTERKRAEAALRESEERQAFLLRLSDALRAEPDADAVLARAVRMLADELRLDRCYATAMYPDGDRAEVVDEFRRPGLPPMPSPLRFSDYPETGKQSLDRTLVYNDTRTDPALSEKDRTSLAALDVRALLSSVVRRGPGNPIWSLAAVSSLPRAWSAAEIRLMEEAAERIWAAVEHARAEHALRESEERLRAFGEASSDVLWIRNAETLQWEYLSPAFEAIYGESVENGLAGENFGNWVDLIVEEDRDQATANIERVRAGESVTFDYRVRRPADGAIRWLRNTDFPMRGPDGEIERIGGVGHDATELKRVEAALAEKQARLRTLMEGIPQLVWRSWDEGDWTWSSPQWQAFTGQTQAASQHLGWLDAVHPEDRDATMRAWEKARSHGMLDVEFRVRRASDGTYLWHHTRSLPVRDEQGRILEWLGTTTDVQELKELQERQAVLVAELQHRTRNLMGVVRSMSDKTARASADLPDFRARFRDRLDALARVQGLLSRLNEHDRVTFDELIRTELSAMDGSAERVTLDGPSGIRLRSSTVQTLAMALHELATNAVKYGALGQSSGRLAIRWTLEMSGEGTPCLHIDWRESGVEMPSSASPRGTGQGRELIERALPYQLSAKTSYTLGPDGVHCTISVPVSVSNTEATDHA